MPLSVGGGIRIANNLHLSNDLCDVMLYSIRQLEASHPEYIKQTAVIEHLLIEFKKRNNNIMSLLLQL